MLLLQVLLHKIKDCTVKQILHKLAPPSGTAPVLSVAGEVGLGRHAGRSVTITMLNVSELTT